MATAGAGLQRQRQQLGITRKRLSRGALKPSVTVHGLTEAKKELNAAAKKVKDLRAVLKPAAEAINTAMSDTFREQRDPAGVGWAPLAPSTLQAKIGESIGGKAGRYTTWKRRGASVKTERSAGQRAALTRRARYETVEIAGTRQRRQWSRGRYITHTYEGTRKVRMLKSSYQAKVREAISGGVKTLVDGGRLSKTVSRVVGKRTIEFGTNVHYGIYHQTGTKFMPARKWAPVEVIGNKWKTIKTGPAKVLWDNLANTIGRFVLHGNNEPPVNL